MDHRHLQIYAWRHGHNKHSISSQELSQETSVDSGIHSWTSTTQNDLVADKFLSDMSMFPGGSAATLASSVANSIAGSSTSYIPGLANLPTPSNHHTSFLSLPHAYTHMPLHPNSQLWAMHLAPTLQISEPTDIDVVAITENTREVRITEDDEQGRDNQDEPLDLSTRRPSPSPSCSLPPPSPSIHTLSPAHSPTSSIDYSFERQSIDRPSVIMAANSRPLTAVRRSSSSVTQRSEPDVHEHFRRSLSGKWPRRQKQEEDKARSSPFSRKPSFNNQKEGIIIHSTPSIEDHFRKALNPAEFNKWKLKQNQ